jgi:hypothetical protein
MKFEWVPGIKQLLSDSEYGFWRFHQLIVYFLKQLIDFLTISGKTVLKPQ